MTFGSVDIGSRELILNVHPVGTGNHPGAWRWPGADPRAFAKLDGYLEAAKVAERGKLDAIFLADVPGLHAPITDYPIVNGLEPTIILSAIAAVTDRIGLVASISTSSNEPYNVARRLRALDLASNGRAGWNAITTSNPLVSLNFANELQPSDERYARADEFVAVVKALWDSWRPDALVADVGTGLFADMTKIVPIDHHGTFYDVRGPITLPPSQQGHPVIFHAGVSDSSRRLTARTGEAMFSAVPDIETAHAEKTQIGRLSAELGRPEGAVRYCPGLITSVGSTEAEALVRREQLDELSDLDGLVRGLAGVLGVDPGHLELDKPVPVSIRERLTGHQGRGRRAIDLVLHGFTVRDVIRRGGASGHITAAGTPEHIADLIEKWYTAGAVDGFTVMPDVTFDGLPAFVDFVVPLLQKRGIFRKEYRGTTLRDHYRLGAPEVATRTELVRHSR
ncbi:NtaA/DmoA family FMN-dependent monooxygenase [Rhodococcoides yunnanense]|uniref:NtaA/DmoA family FMN-dependent monooxygenase n=1 Tax=Rhodococcoides yunnanense TaxID=278209 RepID=UPI000B0790F6|nr:NtaA/DmoA family FMN-dependent monooxygenase [Rhodococcus yunnanensis]